MEDPFRLDRFVSAQDGGGTYDAALAELRAGRKRSHWMWFVFPQIAGLGRSATARTYAITSLAEARAYLAHPVLGPRLIESGEALAAHAGPGAQAVKASARPSTEAVTGPARRSAEEIFGGIDAIKLRSSMTLFARAAPGESVFGRVLELYFDGVPDSATESMLART